MVKNQMDPENLKKLEGPSFACVFATLCALAFQKTQVFDGVIYWFFFTILCGLYIDPLRYNRSSKELIWYCCLPAAWLVGAWALIPAVGIILGGFTPNPGEITFYRGLLILGPITFLLTVLAICLWAVGKGPIISIVRDSLTHRTTYLHRLKRKRTIVHTGTARHKPCSLVREARDLAA
jgi:peptidoglycan/LPS O-acetylase OafA/YrhL